MGHFTLQLNIPHEKETLPLGSYPIYFAFQGSRPLYLHLSIYVD